MANNHKLTFIKAEETSPPFGGEVFLILENGAVVFS